ncbi:GDSL-type esterase/lipase family protein [Planctomycetota bacterium]
MRLSRNRRKLVMSVLAALTVIAGLELMLQALSLLSERAAMLLAPPWGQVVADERLGCRLSPSKADHDANGFRNAVVPNATVVLALGDSQTYGVGVWRDEAWPQQLAALGHTTSYNMACGGYGPVHSLILLEEGLKLKPKVVIEALYSGNDLHDAHSLVYRRGQRPELRSPTWKPSGDLQAAKPAEPTPQATVPPATDARATRQLRVFLAEHSKLWGLLRATKRRLLKVPGPAGDAHPAADGQAPEVVHGEAWRTVLTSSYRLSALDLDNPRIVEGHRVACEAIARMNAMVRKARAHFIVLLIPTKELVFEEVLRKEGTAVSEGYSRLVRMEQTTWSRTKAWLDKRGIDYVDALPALRAQLRRGPQPYPEDRDGHPNAVGHRTVAELLCSELKRRNLLR